MDDWGLREATNQTIFREMNEWIEEDRDAREGRARIGMDTYLCECSDRTCSDPILLRRSEYEAVRSIPIRFAIAMDHENPDVDLLIAENERFAIVDTVFGPSPLVARNTDPRR